MSGNADYVKQTSTTYWYSKNRLLFHFESCLKTNFTPGGADKGGGRNATNWTVISCRIYTIMHNYNQHLKNVVERHAKPYMNFIPGLHRQEQPGVASPTLEPNVLAGHNMGEIVPSIQYEL